MGRRSQRITGGLLLFLATGCILGAYLSWKPYYDAEQGLKGLRLDTAEDVMGIQEGDKPGKRAKDYLLRDIDFEALREINPDIVGWICIPGTPIDYPILKNPYDMFYLDHDYERRRSSAGSIFLRSHEQEDFGRRNTILYGHNLISGGMFSWLTEYGSQEAYEEHSDFYVYLPKKSIRCAVYGSYECLDMSEAYKEGFESAEEWEKWLEGTFRQSSIKGWVPMEDDLVVTLSTCTDAGGKRRVVHAVQKDILYKDI